MSTTKPRTETPDPAFETVDGDTWRLADSKPENFKDVLGALDTIIEKDYPARGEA